LKTESEPSESSISRRQFLLGAGAVAGLAALAPRTASAEVVEYAEDSGLWVAGIVHSIELPSTLHVAGPQDPRTIDDTILFSEDATFWRDRLATLADFEIGDDVFVEGQWEGDVFLGTDLSILSRRIDGSIAAVNLPRIETTGGNARLIPESRWFVDENALVLEVQPEDLVAGMKIWTTGRFDRNAGELVVYTLGKMRE
ncbi:MAG: twin-arginine translocation signal domain-containing protein, partial [Gammaproteobacteria bacterium]